jgi:alginate O-acetyltransferase complex protein AlgI
VNVTWVFFRAHTFGGAWTILRGMFGGNPHAEPILRSADLVLTGAIVGALVTAHWIMRRRTLESMLQQAPAIPLSATLGLMVFAIVIAQGTGNAFIYFQF